MNRSKFVLTLAAACLFTSNASAQLRIVDYNTARGPRTGTDTVLQAISDEVINGFAKQIDVIALQEQTSSATTTLGIVNLLNGIYGAGTYDRATLDGATSGAGRPGLIYNTNTVSLIGQTAFGVVNTSAQARQTLRYQLRPTGYDSSADFYVYSNHYKASTGATNEARRQIEAAALRADLDALGQGTHAILAGDYNIQSSSEQMYQTLTAAGDGQALDPINMPGIWHNNAFMPELFTQSPVAVARFPGQITGGMDDRFDFQLTTGEFLDNEGLSYISGSYHAFGNNGTLSSCCNAEITSGTGASPAVLDALANASDHIPVVADYQLPAVSSASVSAIPLTVQLGSVQSALVSVANAASVISLLGADELDYTVSVTGDLAGFFSDLDAPLGGGNSHSISLDTSTLGLKSGTITVASSSQSVANPLLTFPVSFEVVAIPEPATLAMSLFGCIALVATRRRR